MSLFSNFGIDLISIFAMPLAIMIVGPVAGNPSYLMLLRFADEAAQQFSRHGRIVYDANSHSAASPINLITAWSNASS